MSGNREPGPFRRQRGHAVTGEAVGTVPTEPRPEPVRPVARLPADTPGVERAPPPDVGRGADSATLDPAAQSAARPRGGGWLGKVFLASLGLGTTALVAWMADSALASMGDGSPVGLLVAGALGLLATTA